MCWDLPSSLGYLPSMCLENGGAMRIPPAFSWMMFLIPILLRFVFFHFIFFPPGWTSVHFNSSHNLELIPFWQDASAYKRARAQGCQGGSCCCFFCPFSGVQTSIGLAANAAVDQRGWCSPTTTTLASVFPKKKLG